MYIKLDPFGYMAFGETIGSAWLGLLEVVSKNGELDDDEGRKRLCIQNIRLKSVTQQYPDQLITRFGNKKNIDEIIALTFDKDIMWDFDVVPSFSAGSKSYKARIDDWDMFNFVVKRLSEIPESKKAIMAFVRQEDYQRTLDKPRDDYLPCITSIQFRLLREKEGWYMNTIFNARSIDAFQKAGGNFTAMAMLSDKVAKAVSKNLRVPVCVGSLDGIITDAHIYQESIAEARGVINSYKKYDHNS